MTAPTLLADLLMRRPHLNDLPPITPVPEGYRLRAAHSPADDEAIGRVLTAAFDKPWDAARVRHILTVSPDVRAVYVVEWRGAVVATTSHRFLPGRFPHSGIVHYVGTHPDHRQRGLAAALLAHVLHEFAAYGYHDSVLETQDFRRAALRAYLACGFTPVYEVGDEDHRPRWSAIFGRVIAR